MNAQADQGVVQMANSCSEGDLESITGAEGSTENEIAVEHAPTQSKFALAKRCLQLIGQVFRCKINSPKRITRRPFRQSPTSGIRKPLAQHRKSTDRIREAFDELEEALKDLIRHSDQVKRTETGLVKAQQSISTRLFQSHPNDLLESVDLRNAVNDYKNAQRPLQHAETCISSGKDRVYRAATKLVEEYAGAILTKGLDKIFRDICEAEKYRHGLLGKRSLLEAELQHSQFSLLRHIPRRNFTAFTRQGSHLILAKDAENTENDLSLTKTAVSVAEAIAAQRWKELFENESVHDLVYDKKSLDAIRWSERYRMAVANLVYYRDEVDRIRNDFQFEYDRCDEASRKDVDDQMFRSHRIALDNMRVAEKNFRKFRDLALRSGNDYLEVPRQHWLEDVSEIAYTLPGDGETESESPSEVANWKKSSNAIRADEWIREQQELLAKDMAPMSYKAPMPRCFKEFWESAPDYLCRPIELWESMTHTETRPKARKKIARALADSQQSD